MAGVRKGSGGELGRETTREFVSSRAPRVSLAPETPFPKTPFSFPFKRLPRRLALYWPFFQALVTVPEVFATVKQAQFPSRFSR